jgi:hypothetical protein
MMGRKRSENKKKGEAAMVIQELIGQPEFFWVLTGWDGMGWDGESE